MNLIKRVISHDDIFMKTAPQTLFWVRHYYYFLPWYFIPGVLKLAKAKIYNVYLEWLRWGVGNCERVGKAHSIETLIATKIRWYRNVVSTGSTVLFCRFLQWGCEPRLTRDQSLYRHRKKNMWLAESIQYLVVFLADAAATALPGCSVFCDT